MIRLSPFVFLSFALFQLELSSGQSYFGHGPGPDYLHDSGYSSLPSSPYGPPRYSGSQQNSNPFQLLFGHDPSSASTAGFPSQLFSGIFPGQGATPSHHGRRSHHSSAFPPYLPRYSPEVAQSAPACVVKTPPKIDWGDCPSLEPKEEDKKKKEEKTKECLKDLEVNENSTVDALSKPLQEKARECVLRKDELLNAAGKFQYDKAAEKLKGKGLPENIQKKVEEAHVECKIESESKFLNLNQVLPEVTSYQDCMDFHLAMVSGDFNVSLLT